MAGVTFAKRAAVVGLLLACGAGPGDLPRQFDYACDATLTITAAVVGTRPPPRKVTRRYSVDLDRNLWCWNEDACADTVGPIARVTGREIVFVDKPDHQFSIQRRDGKLSFVIPGLQTTMGTCRVESYTPIPAQ